MAVTTGYRPRRLLLGSLLFSLFPLAYFLRSFIEHLPLSVCPFYTVTGIRCPFCGLTRSLASGLHGDFSTALAYHPAWLPAAAFIAGNAILMLFDAATGHHALGIIWKRYTWIPYSLIGVVFIAGMARYFMPGLQG
jgi:hypothetical protein